MHLEGVDEKAIIEDYNNPKKWIKDWQCQAKSNRLLIHDSLYWHCAEPVGGWGESPNNGRVVITCFFNTRPKGEL
jgi:hypothetical protein